MTSNNEQSPYPSGHPEDLLEAYVLGALEEDERDIFEAHLETCDRCFAVLTSYEETFSLLSQSPPQVAAPLALEDRVMEALEELPPVFVPPANASAPSAAEPSASSRFALSSFAMPLAATLVIGLLSASLIMNVVTTNRLNSLEQERADTAARIAELERGHTENSAGILQLASEGQRTDSSLKQVMETSYLMARPYTQPLLLEPTDGRSDSEGILLVTSDGSKAILMLANMDQPQPPQDYQVWLSRNGQHWPAGEISVDSTGWGTMALSPPESLYGYDWMNLTVDRPVSGETAGGEMVLQTRIISPGAQ